MVPVGAGVLCDVKPVQFAIRHVTLTTKWASLVPSDPSPFLTIACGEVPDFGPAHRVCGGFNH